MGNQYGVTKEGFVLERLDTILEEIHTEVSEGYGFDTRRNQESFLNVLITSFAGKYAKLWEVAQDIYYSKYPTTATGIHLDQAAQYGGIRRKKNQKSYYPIHCTGKDGTVIRKGIQVATNTSPQITLSSTEAFEITRQNFNKAEIKLVYLENSEYWISLNGERMSYLNQGETIEDILFGLAALISSTMEEQFIVTIDKERMFLILQDRVSSRNNRMELSENLTTERVTTIANFATEEYGKVYIPQGLICEILTIVSGFESCSNLVSPTYGRLAETDVEFRHSYLAKSAIRSSRMIDSITSFILEMVDGVASADGFENNTERVDREGRPPHSIEIIVDGGDETLIAHAIVEKKAGGIQTYGNIEIQIVTRRGDTIPIRFNRPESLYVWLKVTLHGDRSSLPSNYKTLTVHSILEDSKEYEAGSALLSQRLNEGIYKKVAGLTYIDMKSFATTDKTYVPSEEEYTLRNVETSARQKILMDANRIEVDLG